MKKREDIRDNLAEMWKSFSCVEIARKFKTSVSTITCWARRLNLPHKREKPIRVGSMIGGMKIIELVRSEKGRRMFKCECRCGNTFNQSTEQIRVNKNKCCQKCYEKKSSSFCDLSGKVFGRLTVLRRAKNLGKRTAYECVCVCGKTKIVLAQNLINKTTLSCGCLSIEKARNNYTDISGQRFSRLIVLRRIGKKWECQCDCGKKIISVSTPLIDGRTKSCGCYKNEIVSGPNSHFWKGGISSLNMESRKGSGSRKWAAAVKKRDGYVCQRCGFEGKPLDYKLHAHHIKCFSCHKELRLDINNGITLCKRCHKAFHDLYGDNADESDLNLFLHQAKTK